MGDKYRAYEERVANGGERKRGFEAWVMDVGVKFGDENASKRVES